MPRMNFRPSHTFSSIDAVEALRDCVQLSDLRGWGCQCLVQEFCQKAHRHALDGLAKARDEVRAVSAEASCTRKVDILPERRSDEH
jgi:hypothetical protein